jgi:hypothetical protein
MSAQIASARDGILTVRITGRLTHSELTAAQTSAAEILRKEGAMRILVIADNFQGWERAGDWGDVSFQMDNDARIEKMAVVGDKKWEELALAFTAKGLRPFPIEYFQPADMASARAWLNAKP